MKKGIGLFLFLTIFSIEAFAAGSTGVLYLIGRVPASYQVKLEKHGDKVIPVVHSNKARVVPTVSLSTEKNRRYVSVVHP